MSKAVSNRYLALLRGVNVGGNAKVSMADLKSAMIDAGFDDVKTYINSGNIIFSSNSNNMALLSSRVGDVIRKTFGLAVDVVVLSKDEWSGIIKNAPSWWGHDKDRKHNLIVLLRPYDIDSVMTAIGNLKPDIESVQPGSGVIYQSLSLKYFGRTTSCKLASNPIYQRMTIRNYNTATKLLTLLD